MKLKLTDKAKLKLMSLLLDHIEDQLETESPTFKMIGTLKQPMYVNGCSPNPIGSPVYESSDRYFLLFTTLDGKKNVEVYYYKFADSLSPYIDPQPFRDCIDFNGLCTV